MQDDLGRKYRGVVRWFSDEKGYGFIAKDGSSEQPDVFVHYSGIDQKGHRALVQGQAVEFYIETSKRTDKPNAVMVRVIEPAPL